ncbi:hypothetical protein NDU88_003914 [Pleurodeles waltl]|uniref:Uncharacterized protein n=1 Tax=Pleurodeles waltl TaxID=8319 RepID=A0AAV7UDW5_PLEWA|nr:hypothetical protein NDU88_003914 [Pleurodeles waltl]
MNSPLVRIEQLKRGRELSDGCEEVNAGLVSVKSDQVRHEVHAGVGELKMDYDEANDEWEEGGLPEEREVGVPVMAARGSEATEFSVGVLQKPRAGDRDTAGKTGS